KRSLAARHAVHGAVDALFRRRDDAAAAGERAALGLALWRRVGRTPADRPPVTRPSSNARPPRAPRRSSLRHSSARRTVGRARSLGLEVADRHAPPLDARRLRDPDFIASPLRSRFGLHALRDARWRTLPSAGRTRGAAAPRADRTGVSEAGAMMIAAPAAVVYPDVPPEVQRVSAYLWRAGSPPVPLVISLTREGRRLKVVLPASPAAVVALQRPDGSYLLDGPIAVVGDDLERRLDHVWRRTVQ